MRTETAHPPTYTYTQLYTQQYTHGGSWQHSQLYRQQPRSSPLFAAAAEIQEVHAEKPIDFL